MLDDFLSLKGGSLSEIGRVMVNEYLLRQRIKANKQQNSLILCSLLTFLFINLTSTFNQSTPTCSHTCLPFSVFRFHQPALLAGQLTI